MFDNQRPGVYSRYDITGFYGPAQSERDAAVILSGEPVDGGAPRRIDSYADALAIFGGGSLMAEALRLLFAEGARGVYAAVTGGCSETLSLLEGADIGVLVCGCHDAGSLAAIRVFLEESVQRQRECIAFTGISIPEDAIAAAESLNCERAVVCCPAVKTETAQAASAVYAACALAGRVLGAAPVRNLSGEGFGLLREPELLPEETVQRLLRAGVCVFEEVGGETALIRALTTRATDGGLPDPSMRSINTVMIIDDVMRSVRHCLRRRLKGTAASVSSIRDQITVELAEKMDAGIISAFEPPSVSPDKSDPSACLVELSFAAAHTPSRIHITAHVTV